MPVEDVLLLAKVDAGSYPMKICGRIGATSPLELSPWTAAQRRSDHAESTFMLSRLSHSQ